PVRGPLGEVWPRPAPGGLTLALPDGGGAVPRVPGPSAAPGPGPGHHHHPARVRPRPVVAAPPPQPDGAGHQGGAPVPAEGDRDERALSPEGLGRRHPYRAVCYTESPPGTR